MSESSEQELDRLVRAIPEGWSRTTIDGRSWAITRTTRARGQVVSIDAEQLGTAEHFGANVWNTSGGAILRPCEVSPEKVLCLLRSVAPESAPDVFG